MFIRVQQKAHQSPRAHPTGALTHAHDKPTRVHTQSCLRGRAHHPARAGTHPQAAPDPGPQLPGASRYLPPESHFPPMLERQPAGERWPLQPRTQTHGLHAGRNRPRGTRGACREGFFGAPGVRTGGRLRPATLPPHARFSGGADKVGALSYLISQHVWGSLSAPAASGKGGGTPA